MQGFGECGFILMSAHKKNTHINTTKTTKTMKTNNIIKLAFMAATALFATTFTSCSDDDDDSTNTLKLSASKVELAPKATATATITNGTAPFTVVSSNTKIATASVTDKTITVTGVAKGSCFIKVTDKNNQTGQLTVTVKEQLLADKDTATVEVGKTADVTISNGTSPYTVTVKDTKVATATVKDKKITIKGVKAGSTVATITDKNKTTGKIVIKVK